jgi:multicomponent Na+:H+ antiporter subunit G
MSAELITTALRMIAAGLVGAAGAGFILLCVIGLLRFPDLFTRAHAFSAAISVGAALILLALAIDAWDVRVSLRLALLAALLGFLGPAIVHLTAGAAHAAGLAPLSGRYVAPRPGAKGSAS